MKNNKEKIKELCDEREALSIDCELKITFINNEIRELEIANRPKPVLHSKWQTDPFGWNDVKLIKGDGVELPLRVFNADSIHVDYMRHPYDVYVRLSDDIIIFSHVLEEDDHHTKP